MLVTMPYFQAVGKPQFRWYITILRRAGGLNGPMIDMLEVCLISQDRKVTFTNVSRVGFRTAI